MACPKRIRMSDNEDLLECPICLEQMTEPYTLTGCLHNFCKACVEKLKQKQQNEGQSLTCPVCRNLSSEVKFNFFLNELLAKERNTKLPDAMITCLHCNVMKPAITLWKCLDCRVNLCEKCKEGHLRFPLTKKHKAIPLVEDASTVVDHLEFCSIHTDEPIKFYCKQCDAAVCITCQVVEHSSHSMVTVQQALDRMIPLVKNCVFNLNNTIDEVDESAQEIERQMTNVKKSYDCILRYVDKEVDELIVALKKEQTAIGEGIKTEAQKQLQHLKEAKEVTINRFKELENLKNVTTTILERSQHVSLLKELTQRSLISRLEKASQNKVQEELDIKKPKWKQSKKVWGQLVQEGRIFGYVVYNTEKISLVKKRQRLDNIRSKYFGCSFVELFTKPLKQTYEIKLDSRCKKVTVCKDKLLVPLVNENIVQVYKKDGRLLKSINAEECTCVEKTHTGEFMLSCYTGIYAIGEGMINSPVKVTEGCYCDICVIGNRVFSWDHKRKNIVEFTRDEVKGWSKQGRMVSVGWLENTSGGDTLLVRECTVNHTDLEFFICVWNQHTVYQVNRQGQKVRAYGSRNEQEEGGLCGPYLCGIDRKGGILVADSFHYKLRVLDTQTGSWSTAFTAKNFVCDVQMDDENSLWFSAHNGKSFVVSKQELVL